MSLGWITVRGVLWNFLEHFLRRGTGAVAALLLSYFLLPQDYGLLSMLALFVALATGLMDSGIREALIRRKCLSERLMTTAFWASLALAAAAALALWVLAPLIAKFYGQPALEPLVYSVTGVLLISALQVVPGARLVNAMNFKALMLVSVPATVLSALCAVIAAWAGFGVWALIIQMYVAALATSALLWRRAGWPLRWRIDWKPLTALYGFGYKLFLSSLLAIVVRNAAPSLIGKFLGAVSAGYYYFADRIMELVMAQLVYSIQNVTYPALVKQGSSDEGLLAAYRKIVHVTTFVLYPCLTIAIGLAQPLFSLVLSERWQGAIPCFQWLCAVYLLYPLHAMNLNILKVKGRSDLFLRLEVIKAAIALLILVLAVQHGLMALLVGQLCSSLLCYLPNSYFSKRLIGYAVPQQIHDVLPNLLVACCAGVVAHVLGGVLAPHSVLLAVLLGGAGAAVTHIALGAALRLPAWSIACVLWHGRRAGLTT
jgi:O-antigen/teichoic acid export membrane protein